MANNPCNIIRYDSEIGRLYDPKKKNKTRGGKTLGNIIYDKTKPDGTMFKLMDVSKINALGWKAKTNLKDGLKIAYNDFLSRNIGA